MVVWYNTVDTNNTDNTDFRIKTQKGVIGSEKRDFGKAGRLS